ncbi:hypothetical protein AK812_SmicGene39997 [Symbiodinium microadriaticum]|uniref:Uncharacterized protein n=1 Tax=Symbiodinium microadriaticum TaxID=2951 RepID=A0A1Q9C9R1_SYMMI|nr:hypothetical protein AK812_SmicGene39997 [Symbiodinium microadriaticum]
MNGARGQSVWVCLRVQHGKMEVCGLHVHLQSVIATNRHTGGQLAEELRQQTLAALSAWFEAQRLLALLARGLNSLTEDLQDVDPLAPFVEAILQQPSEPKRGHFATTAAHEFHLEDFWQSYKCRPSTSWASAPDLPSVVCSASDTWDLHFRGKRSTPKPEIFGRPAAVNDLDESVLDLQNMDVSTRFGWCCYLREVVNSPMILADPGMLDKVEGLDELPVMVELVEEVDLSDNANLTDRGMMPFLREVGEKKSLGCKTRAHVGEGSVATSDRTCLSLLNLSRCRSLGEASINLLTSIMNQGGSSSAVGYLQGSEPSTNLTSAMPSLLVLPLPPELLLQRTTFRRGASLDEKYLLVHVWSVLLRHAPRSGGLGVL